MILKVASVCSACSSTWVTSPLRLGTAGASPAAWLISTVFDALPAVNTMLALRACSTPASTETVTLAVPVLPLEGVTVTHEGAPEADQEVFAVTVTWAEPAAFPSKVKAEGSTVMESGSTIGSGFLQPATARVQATTTKSKCLIFIELCLIIVGLR